MPTPHNSYKITKKMIVLRINKAENDLFNPDKDGTLLILKYSKIERIVPLSSSLNGDAVTAGVVLTLLNDFFTETIIFTRPETIFSSKIFKNLNFPNYHSK